MPRPAPDVEHIFSEAMQLLCEQGVKALSMRSLAGRIGCSPMSLYTHIGKREDLINGIVLRFFRAIEIDMPEGGSWQDKVMSWGLKLRQSFLANPGIVTLISPNARWAVEATVSKQLFQMLISSGFEEAHAVGLCRTLMWQVTSSVMLEAKSMSFTEERLKNDLNGVGNPSNDLHRKLSTSHTMDVTDEIFCYTLGLIIDGLAKERRTEKLPSSTDGALLNRSA